MQERAGAVVVGAGVIGTAVAYQLVKAGIDVAVLEQQGIGSGSSRHGHGVISLVGKDFRPGAHADFGVASARLYPSYVEDLREDSGLDPLYHELPGLALALVDEEEAIFRDSMQRLTDEVEMQWLDATECRELEPRLSPDVRGGVCYRHAQVNAGALTQAQALAVERLGGRIVYGRATRITRRNGRVVGVEYTGGRIATETTVLATGAWLSAVGRWLRLRLPVRPLHGEVLHMRLAGEPLRIFIITARHGPILPRRDGILMVGSIGGVTMSGADVDETHSFDPYSSRPQKFDLQPTPEGRSLMLDRAARVLPVLRESEVVDHLAGVRPLSADRMPLIGSVPAVGGVFVAGGHGTKGIHLAPITATLVTSLILGTAKQEELRYTAAFAPDRFSQTR